MPELEDDNEWEIEDAKDKKHFENELYYLVKWKGRPSGARV
jgi:hypothetical protein